MPVRVKLNVVLISIFFSKAFTSLMPEASETNVPFSDPPPPKSLAMGLSGLIGLIEVSFEPKKELTSITTFLPLWATILNALSIGLIKFLPNDDAIGSCAST